LDVIAMFVFAGMRSWAGTFVYFLQITDRRPFETDFKLKGISFGMFLQKCKVKGFFNEKMAPNISPICLNKMS
jgi:hypothetical protein